MEQTECHHCRTFWSKTNAANIGASIIRIGFGAHYTIVMIRNPQNSIGTYSGPYITAGMRDLTYVKTRMEPSIVLSAGRPSRKNQGVTHDEEYTRRNASFLGKMSNYCPSIERLPLLPVPLIGSGSC